MLERGIEFHMVSRMTGNGVSTQEGDGRGDQWKHDSEYCEHAPSPQSWLQNESCASLLVSRLEVGLYGTARDLPSYLVNGFFESNLISEHIGFD